ncbi:CvpA family protein [Atopobacter phocae]|uniref:CvpA family protein n=1 Tax=Atopobacter phocae TaxID=136492 RepID=UPI00146FC031|nr:CvpA family protein [Atopobacter phocae]
MPKKEGNLVVLTIIIIFNLLIGLYRGARRGFLLQLILTMGYSVSFYVAKLYYIQWSEWVEMFVPFPSSTDATGLTFYSAMEQINLDTAFYRALTFILILVSGVIITRLLGYLLREVRFLPVISHANGFLGAIVGMAVNYMGTFFFLSLLSFVPLEMIQQQFVDSQLAYFIVDRTPFISELLMNWWWR